MADLNFRKLLGHRRWVALLLALLATALIAPTSAYASGSAGISAVPGVPTAAQGAVDAALSQASQAGADAVAAVKAAVQSVPASLPSIPSPPPATAAVSAPPSPQPSPSAGLSLSAAVATPSSTLASSAPRPDDVPGGATAVPRRLAPTPMAARAHGSSRRALHHPVTAHRRAVARPAAGSRFIPAVEPRSFVAGAFAFSIHRPGGHSSPARAVRPHRAGPPGVGSRVGRRIHEPLAPVSMAEPTPQALPPVSASLPASGAESAGGGGAASPGGTAATLLTLAALALLLTFLPGLLALDVLPWRSAALASPLERPG
ncbi:MAG TPA: hypothetical protein VIH85_21095 [Solirubrobacteraceae bacterium]